VSLNKPNSFLVVLRITYKIITD